ncbi:MAG: 4-alpha-glucanotransferase [Acidimicrobiales bacterium]
MARSAALSDPEAWGVAPGYHHVRGGWVAASDRGVSAALDAMGADGTAPPETTTWVVRQSAGLHVPAPATLHTEDGGSVSVAGAVPSEALPLGYHRLEIDTGSVRLIVCPDACPLPARTWGWAVQLYAARSRASWGMGDLADLRRLATWSASALGAGMLLVNPLHAGVQASPYYPTSRRWRSPLYLRVEEVPGAEAMGADLENMTGAGRALNDATRIDREAVWQLKRGALEAIWAGRRSDDGFDRWRVGQGESLGGFATWSALADALGPDWRAWPADLRHPSGPAVRRWAAEHGAAVGFHAWLQWLVDGQLADAAAAGPALVADLAIGADPAGADAWQWQDELVAGVTVGAPPDEFSPGGQDWGLPPFDPWRLRAAGYEPFAQIVRSALGRGGGMRIDHVAGLFRLFWVPAGDGPTAGVYVRYPWQDLLGVVALEAHRAGAFVVGEDLGTVEPEAREALAAHNVLSYRLLWFEDGPPPTWPHKALAAITTHDLPTVTGVWTGADLRARRAIGLPVDAEAEAGLQDTLHRTVAADASAPIADVVRRAHEALSTAPCLLVTATLEDALEVDERPNQPGTVDEWPNWSIPLPLPLEDIETAPGVRAVAKAIGRGRGYPDS